MVAVGPPHVQNPYGLFSVVNFLQPGDAQPYWESGGVTWEAFTALLDALGEAGSSTGLPKNTENDDRWFEKETASPFTVYGFFKGTPIGRGNLSALQARALDMLLAGEQARVEHELWAGTSGGTPNLATDTTDLGSVAGDLVEAVALCEEFLANTYGNLGVIHMSRANLVRASASGALKPQGSLMITPAGTPIVAGTGYTSDLVKCSPAIMGMRSEVFYSQNRADAGDGLDVHNNDFYALAERTYLLGFDPTGVGTVTTGVAAPAVGSPF
jgi:hypothetical protein